MAEPARPEHVFWIEGPRRRARLRLRGSFFLVGRLEPFAVFRDDPMISREHLAVVATEDGVRVRDLGSPNGVLVNGKRLERYGEVTIRAGDVLHAGQTSLRLLREGELEAPGQTALSPGREPERDDVEVDEEGHTRPDLAAILEEPAAGSSDVEGEVTSELVVPDEAALAEAQRISSALTSPAPERPPSVEAETLPPGPPRERPSLGEPAGERGTSVSRRAEGGIEAAVAHASSTTGPVDREAETLAGKPGRGTEGSLGTGKVEEPRDEPPLVE